MSLNIYANKKLDSDKELATTDDCLHNFSTTEHIIGTYIDGKPIYERTFDGNFDVINPQLTKSNLGYETLVNKYGKIWSRYGQYWDIPNTFSEHGYDISYYEGDGGPNIGLGSYYDANAHIIITVQYTKPAS